MEFYFYHLWKWGRMMCSVQHVCILRNKELLSRRLALRCKINEIKMAKNKNNKACDMILYLPYGHLVFWSTVQYVRVKPLYCVEWRGMPLCVFRRWRLPFRAWCKECIVPLSGHVFLYTPRLVSEIICRIFHESETNEKFTESFC